MLTSVYSFGCGTSGQLGDGAKADHPTPQQIQYFSEHNKHVKSVACGSYNTAFVTTDNELYLCGLAISPKDKSTMFATPISTEGEVKINPQKIELPRGIGSIVRVAIGNYHIVVLTDLGTVLTWGSNSHGQLGLGPLEQHTLLPRAVELKCVRQIDAGIKHSAAVNEWGELYVWGNNEHGQLGLGDTNNRKQPTRVTKLKREFILWVACGDAHTTCYTASGKIYSWGQCSTAGKVRSVPYDISFSGGRIRQLACGAWTTTALTANGEVYTWELGQTPALVSGMQQFSVRQIAAGNFHVICSTDDGSIVTFGRNSSGQLGRDSEPGKAAVVSIKGLSAPVIAVAAGEFHSCVLASHTEKTRLTLSLLREERLFLRQILLLENVYHTTLLSHEEKVPVISEKETKRLSLSLGRPMRTLSRSSGVPILASSGEHGEDHVITHEELVEIFSNLDEIIPSAEILVSKLDAFVDEHLHTSHESVGKVFLDEAILSSLRAYIPFSDDYNGACMCLYMCKKASPKLVEILKECDSRARSTGIHCQSEQSGKENDLKARLLLPLQNVPRIISILRELDSLTNPQVHTHGNPHGNPHGNHAHGHHTHGHHAHGNTQAALVKLLALMDRLNQNFQFVDPLDLLNCTPNDMGYPEVMGGSLPQLVERLTHHNIYDPHFRDVFLMTYRAFATPAELMNLLTLKFNEEEATTSHATRIRILQVLTSWLVNHRYDFDAESTPTSLSTSPIAPTPIPTASPTSASPISVSPSSSSSPLVTSPSLSTPQPGMQHPQISEFLAKAEKIEALQTSCKQLRDVMQNLSKTRVTTNITGSAGIEISRFLGAGTCSLNGMLGQVSPDELARQLAALNHAFLVNIDTRHLLDLAWMKGQEGATVGLATDFFNRLSFIVSSEILSVKASRKKKKARAHLISHFINTAEKCLEYNDLAGLAAIVYSLSSSPISRLKKTWDKIHKDTLAQFDKLYEIVSPTKNYSRLRSIMASMQPPCVPFLGIILKDLLFIEEGNPSEVSGLINFYKYRKTAEKIFLILQYQHTRYQFAANVPLREYILTAQFMDEKTQSKISSSLE